MYNVQSEDTGQLPSAQALAQLLQNPQLAKALASGQALTGQAPPQAAINAASAIDPTTGKPYVLGSGQNTGEWNTYDPNIGGAQSAQLYDMYKSLGWTSDDGTLNYNVGGADLDKGGVDTQDKVGVDGMTAPQFLASKGYQLRTKQNNGGSYEQAFDANGQPVGQQIYGADDPENVFLAAILGIGGFGAASVLGAGGAAGVGASSGNDVAGLTSLDSAAASGGGSGAFGASTAAANGTLLTPEQLAAYQQGVSSGAFGTQAADAGGVTFGASGVDGAGGLALQEGAYPASLGATGASTGASSGILGSGITAGQAASGVGAASSAAGAAGLSGTQSDAAASDQGAALYGVPSGTDSASTGSDAKFYNGSSSLGNMGGVGTPTIPFVDTNSGSGLGGIGSAIGSALTNPNGGLSGLGQSLLTSGAGALAGGLLGSGIDGTKGDKSLLNGVNYQQAASAMGQSVRTNQTNAQGSLTYNQNGTDAQGNPTYSQDVQLNAPYQQNLNSALGNQSTALGNLSNYNQGLPGAYANVPSVYGDAGSQAGLVKQAQDAVYNRQATYLDPQYQQQQNQLNQQLANQGVTYGSDAYNNAQRQFSSQRDNAYSSLRNDAVTQGNTYANQLYNQNLQAHQQGMSDISSQGSNYLGQSSGALNGVTQNPSFAQTPAATNYLGAAQLQGNSNLNQYNAQIGNYNSLQGGLFNLGSSLLGNSNITNAIGSGLSGLGSSLGNLFGNSTSNSQGGNP